MRIIINIPNIEPDKDVNLSLSSIEMNIIQFLEQNGYNQEQHKLPEFIA
jgi:hypothetical protein